MKTALKVMLSCCFVLALCCCAACGQAETEQIETEQVEAEQIPENAVVDQLGRVVELPESVDTVTATHIYGGKMLFAMGQKDKLAYQLQLGADVEAVAGLEPDGYGALEQIGSTADGSDSPETMLKYNVDIVFTDVSEGPEIIEMYENAGLTVVAVSGETFEEVYDTARLMGEIFNTSERAEELINFIESKRSLITDRLSDLKDEDKPCVLVSGSGGIFTAATSAMFQHEMIETAGGVNAAASLDAARWARTSPEDIIAWDPDYIVIGSSFGADTVESIIENEALNTVSAIQNKKVYIFPSSLGWWDFPLPQSLLGITWMATVLHHELFSDIDIQTEADEVYFFIYGHTYTEMGGVIAEDSLPR